MVVCVCGLAALLENASLACEVPMLKKCWRMVILLSYFWVPTTITSLHADGAGAVPHLLRLSEDLPCGGRGCVWGGVATLFLTPRALARRVSSSLSQVRRL